MMLETAEQPAIRGNAQYGHNLRVTAGGGRVKMIPNLSGDRKPCGGLDNGWPWGLLREQGMTEAERLFNQTVMRCFKMWGFILSFRVTSMHGRDGARKNIEAQEIAFVDGLLHDPEYERIFLDKGGFFKENPPEELVQAMTESALDQWQVATDAASIVFAHSVLDGAAFDYCRVTALIAPRDWEHVIDQRQVKLADVREARYEDILRNKLDDFFKQFERESLLRKATTLLAICKPPDNWTPVHHYAFELKRLETLDRFRHEVIHGEGLGKGIAEAGKELEYLMKTALYFMGLVNYRYGIQLDPYFALTGRNLQQDLERHE